MCFRYINWLNIKKVTTKKKDWLLYEQPVFKILTLLPNY